MRPSLTAKGSFKNSKSKGNTLVSITYLQTISIDCQKWTGKCSMYHAAALMQQLFSPSSFSLAVFQRCVAKRLANDWRHTWCRYDVIDGIHMTSLPVFSQTFGYPSLVKSKSTEGGYEFLSDFILSYQNELGMNTMKKSMRAKVEWKKDKHRNILWNYPNVKEKKVQL